MIQLTEKEKELLDALKNSNSETFFHSVRVKELTYKMIRLMKSSGAVNFSQNTADTICKGALLHDIGKLYVKNVILTKAAALSKEEMELMSRHTHLGYEAIKDELSADEHDIIMNICLYHHERIDGNGYEQKTDLPLYLQIVSVCDVFDALHSDRIYHRGLPKDKCLNIIRNGKDRSGKFDETLIGFLEKAVEDY